MRLLLFISGSFFQNQILVLEISDYHDFLLSSNFQFVGILIITIVYTILNKLDNKKGKFTLNDYSFGSNLMISSIVLFASHIFDILKSSSGVVLNKNTQTSIITLLFLTIGARVISLLLRRLGWKKNKNEFNILGFILSNLWGILYLYIVFNLIK